MLPPSASCGTRAVGAAVAAAATVVSAAAGAAAGAADGGPAGETYAQSVTFQSLLKLFDPLVN